MFTLFGAQVYKAMPSQFDNDPHELELDWDAHAIVARRNRYFAAVHGDTHSSEDAVHGQFTGTHTLQKIQISSLENRVFFNTNDSRNGGVGVKAAFLAWFLNSDKEYQRVCPRMGLSDGAMVFAVSAVCDPYLRDNALNVMTGISLLIPVSWE